MIEARSGATFVVLVLLLFLTLFGLPMSTIHAIAILRGGSSGDWWGTFVAGFILGLVLPIAVALLFGWMWTALGNPSLWSTWERSRVMYIPIILALTLGLYGRRRYGRLGTGFAVGPSLLLVQGLINELGRALST